MSLQTAIKRLLSHRQSNPVCEEATAFAPVNIALIKYWGKRDASLNLPHTDSLSIALGKHGSTTQVFAAKAQDEIWLNEQPIPPSYPFYQRLRDYLNPMRPHRDFHFAVHTQNSLPTAAGLASSASGFAALALALNRYFGWALTLQECSILARLGSGSACRSLWPGFVHWQAGEAADGSDSYAQPLPYQWPTLRIGLLVLDGTPKAVSSRTAMAHTVATSPRYADWPQQVAKDMVSLQQALSSQDFESFGHCAERNAIAMHSTLQAAQPSVNYDLASTTAAKQQVADLRKSGLPVYFTQDAGPNLKLLFEEANSEAVQAAFPRLQVVSPFSSG